MNPRVYFSFHQRSFGFSRSSETSSDPRGHVLYPEGYFSGSWKLDLDLGTPVVIFGIPGNTFQITGDTFQIARDLSFPVNRDLLDCQKNFCIS